MQTGAINALNAKWASSLSYFKLMSYSRAIISLGVDGMQEVVGSNPIGSISVFS